MGGKGEISFYYFMKWVPKTCASIYVCMYVCMKVMTGEKEDNLEKKNKRVRKTLGQKANLKFCTHKLKKRN